MVRAIISPAIRAFEASIIEAIGEAFLIYSSNICYGSRDGNSIDHYLTNYAFLLDCDVTWTNSVFWDQRSEPIYANEVI